jgi:hypothetical protein
MHNLLAIVIGTHANWSGILVVLVLNCVTQPTLPHFETCVSFSLGMVLFVAVNSVTHG